MTERAKALKFPAGKDRYELLNVIGAAPGATVYAANYVPASTGENRASVTIKVFQLDQVEDVPGLTQEIEYAETSVDHNTINVHCSFKLENQLWVVISNPAGFVSLRSVMSSCAPTGLSESAIAYISREILWGLISIHSLYVLRGKFGFDTVFLSENSEVKLAFGSLSPVSWSSNNECDDPDWMLATEVKKNLQERGMSGEEIDIWMFGLLALKLRFGRVPAKDFEELESIIINGIDRNFGPSSKKKGLIGKLFGQHSWMGISKAFGELLWACLSLEPGTRRPTASRLVDFNFFRKCSIYRGLSSTEILKPTRPSMNRRRSTYPYSGPHPAWWRQSP